VYSQNVINMSQFYDQLVQAVDAGEPFALGIISGIKGSSPQKKGAKALFFRDGRIIGTLGGGCLEAEIQDRARRALLTGQPAIFDLVLDHDFGWDDGLICGGKVSGVILPRAAESADVWRAAAERKRTMTWGVRKDFTIDWVEGADAVNGALAVNAGEWLYRETISPPWMLWIAGSGHVAQAVAPLARQVDFEVTVFDDRPTFASAQFFPGSTKFRIGSWEELLQSAMPEERPSFGLIVTRGHQRDALVLASWIHRPFAFLGMIGSRRKRRLIFEQFIQDGVATAEQLATVACPVGLGIGSRSVPEIALSIVGQLVQKRAELLQATEVRSAPVTSAKAAVTV
jgi:xanthine dehydrogenase accessory factor